jgi:hypothetical protein
VSVPQPAVAPELPAVELSSARVVAQSAFRVSGATATSINRAIAGAGPQLADCYRAALPRMSGPLGGDALLHVETDGAGTITDVHMTGQLAQSLERCVAQALRGRRVANVDTGSASADVPLVFRPR